jgi:hypothetical protein
VHDIDGILASKFDRALSFALLNSARGSVELWSRSGRCHQAEASTPITMRANLSRVRSPLFEPASLTHKSICMKQDSPRTLSVLHSVDDLDEIDHLEEYVNVSQCMLIFLSKGYFFRRALECN